MTLPPALSSMDALQTLDLGFINSEDEMHFAHCFSHCTFSGEHIYLPTPPFQTAVAYGTVPSSWIQAGAFPSLKTLDLSFAYLDGFGASWYAPAKLGGMPAIQNLLLYNPFSDTGGCRGRPGLLD